MRLPPFGSVRRTFGGLALAMGALGGSDASAQEMPLLMDLQVSLLKRIWAFDRAHPARVSDDLVVGVVYQEMFRPSLLAKTEFTRAMESEDWGLRDVRVVPLRITAARDLEDALVAGDVDIMYVTPLRSVGVDAVVEASRRQGVLTCTGVPAYVAAGVSVGLDLVDGRPRILVNRGAARAEGADFSSELLKLAELVPGR